MTAANLIREKKETDRKSVIMQIKTGIIEPYTKNRIQDGGCGCMDENTAWKNFVNTGKVSDYLAYCREKGIEPEKAYSGKLVLRMKSDLHSDAADKANSLGISLNEFINRAVAAAL